MSQGPEPPHEEVFHPPNSLPYPQLNIHSPHHQPIHIPHLTPTHRHTLNPKRKIRPRPIIPTLNDGIQLPQFMNKMEAINNKCLQEDRAHDEFASSYMWIFHQYFTPNCDQQFLEENSMLEILHHLELQQPEIPFQLYRKIKSLLPKTKLFSKQFIEKQRETLRQNRHIKHHKIKNIFDINLKSFNSLKAGDHIWAYNPSCQHIHSGTILTHFKQKNIYAIKFNKSDLGSVKLPEFYISSIFVQNSDLNVASSQGVQGLSSLFTTENTDFKNFATFRWFIELKRQLIFNLREYHDIATKLREKGQILSQVHLQEYGWIGSMISLINIFLKYMMTYHSLPFPQKKQTIRTEKHWKSTAISPNPIYLQISSGTTLSQSSEEKKDARISKYERKKLKEKDQFQNIKQIDQIIEAISSRYSNLNESLGQQRSQQMQEIIKTLIGILSSIKDKGKGFNSMEDKYLNQLDSLISSKYPEHFNDIYDMIRGLMRKLS